MTSSILYLCYSSPDYVYPFSFLRVEYEIIVEFVWGNFLTKIVISNIYVISFKFSEFAA